MSKSFEELISKANQKTLKKVSVSNAQDEPVLQAVKAAKEQNIATAILVGDEAKIREIAASIDMDLTDFEIINEPDTEAAALKAVELVHNGKADILLKGLLETKTFLKSVLISGFSPTTTLLLEMFRTCSVLPSELAVLSSPPQPARQLTASATASPIANVFLFFIVFLLYIQQDYSCG